MQRERGDCQRNGRGATDYVYSNATTLCGLALEADSPGWVLRYPSSTPAPFLVTTGDCKRSDELGPENTGAGCAGVIYLPRFSTLGRRQAAMSEIFTDLKESANQVDIFPLKRQKLALA